MSQVWNPVTKKNHFFNAATPFELVSEFGSPLFVYNESIFRARCREMRNLVSYPRFFVNYSVKANSNLTLLRIAREEGLLADAMSPGEIFVEAAAGYTPDEILYISNNVSEAEMRYAIDRGIMVSVDSLSQLEMFGRLCPGGKVCVRVNTGVGAGHHAKVITGGKKTKFAVDPSLFDKMREILRSHRLTLAGLNQHIGSLFMEPDKYLEGVSALLSLASTFEDLEFIDFGGGFGIPYEKAAGQPRLDLADLGAKLDAILHDFARTYGKSIAFKVEPGRYIAAESCVLLGTVHAVKENYGHRYVGTDVGFNVPARPMIYDSHHDMELYRAADTPFCDLYPVTVVGNICESGDILAKDRMLPQAQEGDIIGILDAGAYGYSMSSNYNNRLRPAEVLLREDGTVKLIRRRDTLDDLLRNF